MKSIKELYRIGRGPSSSHTMGPAFAAALIRKEHPEADAFHVVLYGSLAKTGRGHRTDPQSPDLLAVDVGIQQVGIADCRTLQQRERVLRVLCVGKTGDLQHHAVSRICIGRRAGRC